MSTDNAALIQQIQEGIASHPVHARMGLRLEELSPARTVVTMPFSEEIRGAAPNSVHGGMLAALADITCAMAIAGTFDWDKELSVTTDMHIRYLGQPRSWPVRAVAQVIHRGRRLTSIECAITDSDERHVARATATYILIPQRRDEPSA